MPVPDGLTTYRWLLLGGVLNAGATTPVGRFLHARPEATFGRQLRSAVRDGVVELVASPVVSAHVAGALAPDGAPRLADRRALRS